MDNNRIQGLYVLFIAFGISTGGGSSKYKKITICIVWVYLVAGHGEFVAYVSSQNYSHLLYLTVVGHMLIICIKITHMVIAWQTLLCRRGESQIFTEFTHVDDLIAGLFHWIDFKQTRRVVLYVTIPLGFISFVFFLIHVLIFAQSTPNSKVPIMSLATSLVIRMRYIQYVYMLILVREKLKALKCAILENSGPGLRIGQLYKMKDVFHRITTICGLVNDVFGLSILFMVIASVIQLVWILHWLVLTLENSQDVSSIVRASIVILSECLGISIACKIGEDCESLSKELPKMLARMDGRNFEVSHCLEDFSLQVMHDPVSFTANGFFSLNFQTFAGMIVMAITQLFVLMQFSKIGTPIWLGDQP